MPRRPTIPPALRGVTFRGSAAMRDGLLTRGQLASSAWRRLFRDVYVQRSVEIDHRGLCVAAVEHVLPSAVVTGASAAYLHGVRLVGPDDPVELLTPAPHGPVHGIRLHHGPLDPGDLVEVDGLRVASPTRTVWDLVCHRDLADAARFVDPLLRLGRLTGDDLAKYAWEHRGEPGYRLMEQMAELADAGSESPQESRTCVELVLAGVPKPRTQYVIRDGGRFVARSDLAWPEYLVALEYDGYDFHHDRSDLSRDRARLNRQLIAGWLVIHVTGDRLRRDLPGVVAEVLAALRSRGWPGPPRLP
ncbi:very-short-patch-repair endonuclease [Hamadaea flava]|uniref:DUF559 domain-containing protein n=1 Tax=Hamadaea flava TaxID=1742688 RepID=A0ABV8LFY7_9ACTN|nr:hypothetical protein [Hamadaea flava]MCP2326587.1 very-short-patch-repair endonuclease [Hamadaea flava]